MAENFRDPFAYNNATVLGRMLIQIPVSFETDGTNDPVDNGVDGSVPRGFGYVVTRTDVGTFEVKFKTKWPQLLSGTVGIQNTTLTDSAVQLGDYDSETGTLVVFTSTAGVAADLDGPRVNLNLWMTKKEALSVL